MRSTYWRYSLIAMTTFALFTGGCGADPDQVVADDPHAGHDHGPGEHVLAQPEAPVDPHTGHDHGPGEGHSDESEVADWCVEHEVPESACTACHPELIDNFKATGDWCAGHDLPESHCRLCNPEIQFPQEELIRQERAELAVADISVSLWHRPNAAVCATDGALIQFASTHTADRTGLTVREVMPAKRERIVEAPAEVIFSESHSAVVSSTVPALVTRWVVSPGDAIMEGEVLAILSSPDIADLGSRLLAAHAALAVERKEADRYSQLMASDLVSEGEYELQQARFEQAQAEFAAARGLLAAAGLSQKDISDFIEFQRVTNSFALRAPVTGVVVDRIAQLGELVEAGGAFALLADPTEMWIEARLSEEQMRSVDLDQTLLFASDGRGLDRVGARVTWISGFLDSHTRTGIVRAEVVDPDHGLHAGEFGRVTIVDRSHDAAALVPKDAVQWEGCCNVVFVRESDRRYRPRKVELLGGTGSFYQVSGDVRPGDQVVVDGAFLLKTELQKASLGSGCCGLEPTG